MPAKEVGFELPTFQSFNFVVMQPGDKRKLAFLQAVPGKDHPITVMKRHYFAEEQNGSKYVMCTGGLCCQYETWDNFSKTYHAQKAKQVYWVPCVYYYSDSDTMMPRAGVGIIAFNYYQYKRYVEQVNSTKPNVDAFFQQDITVSFDKNGQYGDYAFIKDGSPALYLTNPQMKAEVEDQLKTFAQAINDALPPEYSEIELAAKIEEWNKVKAARSMTPVNETVVQPAAVVAQPASQLTAQPAVQQIPAQPAVQQIPVQSTVAQSQVVQPQVQITEVATQPTVAQPTIQVTEVATPPVNAQPTVQPNPVEHTDYSLEDLASVLQNVQNS